jgi:hypothetical protein
MNKTHIVMMAVLHHALHIVRHRDASRANVTALIQIKTVFARNVQRWFLSKLNQDAHLTAIRIARNLDVDLVNVKD